MCARFEDALAEGRRDTVVSEHAAECVRCHMLLEQLDGEAGVLQAIATVSAPVPLPAGFTEGVLARALPPERYLKQEPPKKRFRLWHHGLTGLAAGAATALIFWAGGQVEELAPVQSSPQAVEMSAAGESVVTSEWKDAFSPILMALQEDEDEPTLMQDEEPVVRPAAAVPEPKFNLPGELKMAVIRLAKEIEGCPAELKLPVRITLTVGADGSLSNRTVYSVAAQGAAHDCVNKALDALVLPPVAEHADVTLDIVW
jgi:hypothetical protein